LIAKFETFYILNVLSQYSPRTIPPAFTKPFSGTTFTSGLTPFPLSFVETHA